MNPTHRRTSRPVCGKRGRACKPITKQSAVMGRQGNQIGIPARQNGALRGAFGNKRRNSFAKSARPQKAANEGSLVDDANARSAQSTGGHPEPPDERSGERSVIHFPDAARGTLRFQNGKRAAGFDRPLDGQTRPPLKLLRDIGAFSVENSFSPVKSIDFAWRTRTAETPFLLGANRHQAMFAQLFHKTRIRFGRSIESASSSQKAVAHRYVHHWPLRRFVRHLITSENHTPLRMIAIRARKGRADRFPSERP